MRRATGVILILAGAAASSYYWFPADGERQASDRLASLVRIAAEGTRQLSNGHKSERSVEIAAQSEALAKSATAGTPVTSATPAPAARRLPFFDKPAQFAVAEAPATGSLRQSGPAGAMSQETAALREPLQPVRRFTSAKPMDADGRRDLSRTIQGELKRVGCYDGEIDGVWAGSTRKAMKSFTDRINASLPVEEPDYILLTLLQGHSSRACGTGCPTGQVLVGDGRCQPQAVVAQAGRQSGERQQSALAARSGHDAGGTSLANGQRRTAQPPLSRNNAAGRSGPTQPVDPAIEEARQHQDALLEQRKARIDAEREARLRVQEEQRARIDAAADDARRRQQAELEQQRLVRAEADRLARLTLAEQERARAEVRAEERRRRQIAAQEQQLARQEAERSARAKADEERRVKAELAQAEARRREQVAAEQRQARLEAQRIARAAAEEERRIKMAKVEADRQLKARLAEEERRQELASAESARRQQQLALVQRQPSPPAATQLPPLPGAESRSSALGVADAAAIAASVGPIGGNGGPVNQMQVNQGQVPAQPTAIDPPEAPVVLAPKREPKPQKPRFVQRFVPPPTYNVGRAFAPQPVYRPQVSASGRGDRIFSSLSRHAP